MSAALRLKVGVFAAGLSYLLAVGYAQAQQQPEQQFRPAQAAGQAGQAQPSQQPSGTTTYFRGPDSTRMAAGGASQGLDHYLASCLLIKNDAEVKANEFGAKKAQSDEVKQFARQMIQDHREMSQKLSQLASSAANRSQAGQSLDSNRAANPAAGAIAQSYSTTATTVSPAGNSELSQLLELDRQITDRCSQMVREKLEQKSGAEFDECFVGAQIGNHIHMLAALEVISQRGGSELQQVAEDAKSKVESHLKQAEQLAEQLKSDSKGRVERQARRQ
jgi:predicted outer membrane protein